MPYNVRARILERTIPVTTPMKYLILVGDGMVDDPRDFPGGGTPLVTAPTPHLDRLAREGETGWVATVPAGMEPGSDVANMSLLGYSPREHYRGRAPLEAAAMGVDLSPHQTALRCNLVHLVHPSSSGLSDGSLMESYSAGHITTAEARQLVESLQASLGGEGRRFYPGVSYRHLLVLDHWEDGPRLTPPHDISGRAVGPHLPGGKSGTLLRDLMRRAAPILESHPVNASRAAQGLPTANAVWFWGEGRRPAMPPFRERFGLEGAVVSAVDLIKGLGRILGMRVLHVPGATGWLDTDYGGKVEAALAALAEVDLVFLHVEAPDEAGHQGDPAAKIQAVDDFDRKVVGPSLEGLERFSRWTLLVTADHPTPLRLRTHSLDPVPWVIRRSGDPARGEAESFGEVALVGRPLLPDGESLMRRLIQG
jgi:2,3-bisphosphoglycerate-independent phosphoglycerate mutase